MNNRRYIAVLLALVLGAGFTGCAGRDRTEYGQLQPQEKSMSFGTGGGYAMAGASAASFPAAEEMYEEEMEADYDMAETYSSADSGITGAGAREAEVPAQDASGTLRTEKLVYTGNLTVETTDFTSTLDRIRQTITDMGGFIESEDDSDYAYGWYLEEYRKSSSTLQSYIQARIPSARFYEFLDGIEGDSAKVTNRSVNVQNISRRYSETATSVESYEIQERRLLEMMENAARVSDMLEIEARLSEVQEALKQYRNSLSDMDTDVAYSVVTISIQEVGIYSGPEAATFGERMVKAFKDGISSFAESAQAFCIWLTGNFLNILVFILVLWILASLLRRFITKRKKYRDGHPERMKRKKKDLPAAEEPDADAGKDVQEKDV